ncbi:MAG TPA: 2-oxoglutarate dehydrogenase complex dihydrolipoyllysine-residue succinyltransferase [Chromatiales bacterium]|nr:2-oxoglutarate dehydrogenase complex dihydrolipoyllysine-residue succinyltransferase [Chromatiales bacterium]
MSTDVRVPPLPESVADATVLSWHKQAGDEVKRDDTLLDLETDKVVLEVPAPENGVLHEIRAQEGDVVKAGDLLATIEAEKARPTPPSPAKEEVPSPDETRPEPRQKEPALSPAVRRMVKEFNLDPTQIVGTGKDGRLLKADVIRHLDSREDKGPKVHPDAGSVLTGELAPVPGISGESERPEQRVRMTRLRARIAERLVQAQQTAAILTTFNEVNLKEVVDLRARYRESFEKQYEVKLGFMSFFVKAAVEALKLFPVVNASVDGEEIVYHGYYDIGIAVSSPRGLVVPVLRDADRLGFAEVEKAIRDFGQKAREGTLSYDELTGGTFTISNGGVFGSMLSTPIINPPQSAILGMHTIQERPVVENGEIVIRPMMYLALSYDHRIIDGKEAVQFLVSVKETLEDPARLLLEV